MVVTWSQIAVIVSGVAVAVSGSVALGIWLGSLRSSTRSAHHRIDDLEEILKEQLGLLRSDLRDAIQNGWRHCPLAVEHKERKP